jgi:hypothetical protein
MYQGLLHSHSGLRYLVLLLMVAVIVKSLLGFTNQKPFQSLDRKLSLWLLITTHLQFVLGLWLYFVSPFVQWGDNTMKEAGLRYWAVEHLVGMLVAIALTTIAHATAKRMTNDTAKHRRLFVFNTLALIVIIVTILQSGDRKVFFFF